MADPSGTAPPPAAPAPAAPPVLPSARLTWSVIVAAAVFIILEFADAFVAVPLRECSSILSQLLLDVTGFPVTRQGTILSTPQIRFDVVPACSGSTTLRVLLAVTILWCGIHPRLTPLRRAGAVLAAVPLALLANAVRVSILVAAGHMAGEAPGDVLHVGAGLVAFTLAMVGSFAVTDRLGAAAGTRLPSGRAAAIFLAVLLLFLYAPFLAWCFGGWRGAFLDAFGWVFMGAATVAAIWAWRRMPDDASWEGRGTTAFGLSLLVLLAATLADINLIKGLAFLSTWLAVALSHKGPRFMPAALLVAALAYLGFPTVGYQIALLLFGGPGSAAFIHVVKSILGALIILAFAFAVRRLPAGLPARGAARRAPLRLLFAAVLAAFQAYYLAAGGGAPSESRLDMSFLQGDWVGINRAITPVELQFIGRDRVWSRRYVRVAEEVDVLITSTGGDRRRAHPPEYCLTGAGWETVRAEKVERRLGDGRTVAMTQMRLRKGPDEVVFCYWFTSGTEEYAGYGEMLFRDLVNRLGGRGTDWFLFRLIGPSREETLVDFLSTFQAKVLQ